MEFVYLVEFNYDNDESYPEDRDECNNVLGIFDSFSGAKEALEKIFDEKYKDLAEEVEYTHEGENEYLDFVITSPVNYPGNYQLSVIKWTLNDIDDRYVLL